MFDIGFDEMLAIAIVAIVVIGPKDLPMALRTAGRWVAKVRRVSGHFRSGIETMIREAELEEMEKTWRDHNAAIMAASGGPVAGGQAWVEPAEAPALAVDPASAEAALASHVPAGAPHAGEEPSGPPLPPP